MLPLALFEWIFMLVEDADSGSKRLVHFRENEAGLHHQERLIIGGFFRDHEVQCVMGGMTMKPTR